jgi:hypothetical protein
MVRLLLWSSAASGARSKGRNRSGSGQMVKAQHPQARHMVSVVQKAVERRRDERGRLARVLSKF